MRHTVLCLATAILFAFAALASAEPGEPLSVETTPERLNPEAPDLERLGALAWRGGLRLTSDHPEFGGLSGLLILEEGRKLLAVTDRGSWVTAKPVYDGQGWLAGLEDARIGPLLDLDGTPVASTSGANDAEALALLPKGEVLVSFERKHRVLRYALIDGAPSGQPTAFAAPGGHPEGSNEGLEGLVEVPGGVLGVSEGLTGLDPIGKTSIGFLWTGEAWAETAFRPRDDLAPVGAAPLPDNSGILLLERHWSRIGGIRVRLSRVPMDSVRPGGVSEAVELAFFRPPIVADNYEGVAARSTQDGETLIYIVSDDNFNVLQRNLLVMFALKE
jgi:hypothetical protein